MKSKEDEYSLDVEQLNTIIKSLKSENLSLTAEVAELQEQVQHAYSNAECEDMKEMSGMQGMKRKGIMMSHPVTMMMTLYANLVMCRVGLRNRACSNFQPQRTEMIAQRNLQGEEMLLQK